MAIIPRALELILEGEISSVASYTPHPIWPGGKSGVTIGVGYDIGQHRSGDLERDWGAELGDADLNNLARCCGICGNNALRFMPSVKSIQIPWASAERVFSTCTIPQYEAMTLRAFPGCDQLPPETYGALVSLVYNRGAATSGERREEMGAIRECVANGDWSKIPDLIRSMSRLWINTPNEDGMRNRRNAEADLAMEGLTNLNIKTV